MASQRYQNCSEHLKFAAVLMLMLTFTCSHQCVEQCIGISSSALMTSLSQKTDEACWLRVNQDGRVVTVGLTRDHKPEVEKECGAVRLRQEPLFTVDGTTYLSRDGCQGQPVQRLAVSRSLGDFDLTGELLSALVLRTCMCKLCGLRAQHTSAGRAVRGSPLRL